MSKLDILSQHYKVTSNNDFDEDGWPSIYRSGPVSDLQALTTTMLPNIPAFLDLYPDADSQ